MSAKSRKRTTANAADTHRPPPEPRVHGDAPPGSRPGRADVEDEGTRAPGASRRRWPATSSCRCRGRAAGRARSATSLLARPLHRAGVDSTRPRVVDADRSERRLDRLVEPEQHRARALLEHRVVRRFGCQSAARAPRPPARSQAPPATAATHDEHRPAAHHGSGEPPSLLASDRRPRLGRACSSRRRRAAGRGPPSRARERGPKRKIDRTGKLMMRGARSRGARAARGASAAPSRCGDVGRARRRVRRRAARRGSALASP